MSKIKIICPTCNKEFYRWRCQVESGQGKFCCRKCVRRTNDYIENVRERQTGSNNSNYKKNAGLKAIHLFIRSRFDKPDFCQNCNINKPYDLANISQKYKRLLTDWKWLCRKCHMIEDGRLEKFKALNPPRKQKTIKSCSICNVISHIKGNSLCLKCYEKVRYYHRRRSNQTHLKNISLSSAIKIVRGML